MAMADEWFYARDNQQCGPIAWAALQAMAVGGQLAPTDLVWAEGAPSWAPAATIPGLFATQPAAFQAGPGVPLPYAYGIGELHPPGTRVQYAGFWLRFVAAILDGLILLIPRLIISGALTGLAGGMNNHANPNDPTALMGVLAADLIGIVMEWLYFALMESSKHQATLGKMALGLKVTDLQGNRISFGRATGRYFGKIISGLILFIGYMMAGWTEKKQALHDMMASTLVIRKR
jgi:uncharacterized RDD family membrane protein YckC